MRWLFRKSRWIHKWIGLLLVLYMTWMGLSGILLNHPAWISWASVPPSLVPPQYRLENWNRGALTEMAFSERDPAIAFVGGTQGVWKTTDGGRTFEPMDDGYPASIPGRVTSAIHLDEGAGGAVLLAGTDDGLFTCDPAVGVWSRVPVDEPVRSIVGGGDGVLVFTDSHAYGYDPASGALVERQLARSGDDEPATPSLVTLFFDLHSGGMWGLGGRLVYDVAGVLIVFLSLSAFYVWFSPWNRRRKRQRREGGPAVGKPRGLMKFLFKYHLKIGIWVAPLFLVIAGTGFFLRPPMLVLLTFGTAPTSWYPAETNPWAGRIMRVAHDAPAGRIIIEATDGFWIGPDDLGEPFTPHDPDVPIHVMGTNVLRSEAGRVTVGSFSGMFRRDEDRVMDLVTGQPAGDVSTFRLSKYMVTGYFRTPAGEEFMATHKQGLVPLGSARLDGRFTMPAEMSRRYRVGLWTCMFELHNGRVFRDLIGNWYKLIPPLGSALFFLITVTGIFDWCYMKLRPRRSMERAENNKQG